MTIDEAITHAREVAKSNKTKATYDDKFLKRFCTSKEACIKCAEENEQLAEWLEELKALRHEANEWRKAGYSHGYNKAIDEAMDASAKAICIGCGYLEGTKCKYKGGNCGVSKPMLETVMKALEQLKKRSE